MVTLLLTLKAPLHKIAGAVSEDEILAILKFGVVSVILVPILPTRALSYLGGLAPRTLGLLVVLLSAVSLGGYLLVRIYGRRRGWALAGLLGGLVSSTAVTLSMSGKARAVPGLTRALGVGVLLASSILYLRSLVVIGILDRTLAYHLVPRLAGLLAIGLAFAGLHFRAQATNDTPDEVSLGNPAELGRAFGLALMFAAVMLASRLAQARLGTLGLFSVGLVGGLVDVDSVAVATARLHQQGLADLGSASGTFLLATLSNLVFKGGVVLVVGGPQLSRIVLPAFGVIAVATGLALGW
jgi:uncharacterized membrane protein (DUF4010 family)